MSNESNTGAAVTTFVPSAEEMDRLAAWDRQAEMEAPPSGPWIPDYSEERARGIALAPTFSEEEGPEAHHPD